MSISVTCPTCQARLKMPEALIGKKIRCKACQAVIPANVTLPATSDSEAPVAVASEKTKSNERETVMVAASGDTQNAETTTQASTRRHAASTSRKTAPGVTSRNGSSPLPAWKKAILYVSLRPWAVILLFYLMVCLPVAILVPLYTTLIEMLIGVLLVLGIVGGTIMALIGVSMRNPFEMLTLATIGVIAGAIMPTEYASAVGKVAGKATEKQGKRPLGEADTGVGGSIAIYSCLGLVLLFVHMAIKSMIWVATEKAKM